ncbi:MAG: hypothetical protein P9M15_07710, partial [Candidatus Electryoneaceae bacterium]|nr:hypothetical protein [Candidatus Electryoneaceae bacterium]
ITRSSGLCAVGRPRLTEKQGLRCQAGGAGYLLPVFLYRYVSADKSVRPSRGSCVYYTFP